jgi:hypothetical protein
MKKLKMNAKESLLDILVDDQCPNVVVVDVVVAVVVVVVDAFFMRV